MRSRSNSGWKNIGSWRTRIGGRIHLRKSRSGKRSEAAMASYDEVMAAVAEGDMKRVCFLVQGEPGILVRTEGGGSLLLTALYRGRQDLVDVLAPRVHTDVFEAAALGDVARVIQLVKKDPEVVSKHSSDGWTALHLAAFMGHQKTGEALLEMGADVSELSRNQMANQPLHAALAGKTDPGVVQMLIERGADVN